jgi:hypothetical protein
MPDMTIVIFTPVPFAKCAANAAVRRPHRDGHLDRAGAIPSAEPLWPKQRRLDEGVA